MSDQRNLHAAALRMYEEYGSATPWDDLDVAAHEHWVTVLEAVLSVLVTCQTCVDLEGTRRGGACPNPSCVDGKDYAAALTALGFDRVLADRHPDDPNRIIMNGWLGVTE